MEYHTRERGERGVARRENLEELVTACRQFGQELAFPLDASNDDDALASELDEFWIEPLWIAAIIKAAAVRPCR